MKLDKLRIALFTDTYYPYLNGVTTAVEAQALLLRQKGHKVYIFAPLIRGFEDTDPDVIRLPSVPIPTLPEAVRLPIPLPNRSFRNIYRLKFDIIHAHGNGMFSLIGYHAARVNKKPYIVTFHTLFTEYMHYLLYGKVFKPVMAEKFLKVYSKLCDRVIVPTEKTRNELLKFGVKKNIEIVPYSINVDRFKKVNSSYLHDKYHIPKGSTILLSVGRLGKEKNFEFLIEAFQVVAQTESKSHLVIVGYGKDRQRLWQRVDSLGLTERVHFVGKISQKDMPLVYSNADIFVFASTSETQGICVLEAAACELPLIVAEDPAYHYIVENGVNGFRLPLKKEVFADRVIELLQNDKKKKEFGKNSRKIVQKYFSGEAVVEELLKVYKATLAPLDK